MIARAAIFAAARIALVVAVAAIVHLATTDRSYPLIGAIWDKANHVLAFGVLSLLADLSFPETRFGLPKVLALLAFGLWIEAVQYLLPNHEASLLDWLADGVGIALYLLSLPLLGRVLPMRRPEQG